MDGSLGKIESKLGFDRVRKAIAERCSTDYAVSRAETEAFSTDPLIIRERLQLTDEMRLVCMFEESFPTTGYIDAKGFLEMLQNEGTRIDVLSLGKLKTLLDTVRKILVFFGSIKDGIYPNLKRLASGITFYPEVLRRIENILDKYGEVRDSASDELFKILRELRAKEGTVAKKAAAVLAKAQAAGESDADAQVVVRDGKYLVPVAAAYKRRIPGYVYGESATGKTIFIEPAEVVELENELAELCAEEAREIERILWEFSEFVRPYLPEIIESAAFIGEVDFIMAKARTALAYRAGMPIVSDDGSLRLRKARHPLLEAALKKEGREMVPLSVVLTPESVSCLYRGPMRAANRSA